MDDVLGYVGRRVVVTGAASGMGQATARILVDVGAEVIGVDVAPIQIAGVRGVRLDLRERAAIDAVTDEIGPVDNVFACAGVPGAPFSELDTMLVNFVGGRHFIEQLIPEMREGAAIAWVASNAGLGWQQQLDLLMPLVKTKGFDAARAWCEEHPEAFTIGAYSRSKQAINAWVAWRAAALVRRGIRLNCTNPGPTSTPMMPFFEEIGGKEVVHAFNEPIGRDSEPEEQAWPLVFLNSPRMSYVTGESLHADGGFLGAVTTGQIDIAELLSRGARARSAS
jgi:NAD(P)-dependent dehydrogenase (short-subunit alcohol dehydrogenase family)